MPIDQRILNKHISSARILAARIKGAYTNGEVKTIREIETTFGCEFPEFHTPDVNPSALDVPIEYGYILSQILDRYIKSTPERLEAAATATAATSQHTRLRLSPPDKCYRFTANPARGLYPEQDPVFRQLYADLYEDPTRNWRTAWNNGRTGSGKTEIINAVVDYFIAQKRYINPALPFQLPYTVVIFTVTNAVEQSKKKARLAGLGWAMEAGLLQILPYSVLYSSEGEDRLWRKVTTIDPITDQEIVTFEWIESSIASLYVFDECHKLKKEDTRTAKMIRLLDEACRRSPLGANTKFLFFSATLAEKINDTKMFVCMSDITYNGNKITYDNFNISFGSLISNGEPDVPNKAAMERFRKFFKHRLYEIPKIRWPFSSTISLKFFKFLTAEDKLQYDNAVSEYLEQIAKLGKNTPNERALRAIKLLKLRKKVEPIRSKQIAKLMVDDVARGETAIMGADFVGSIIKTAFHLIDDYGVKREEIAIIWGGCENVKPSRIYTKEEMLQLATDAYLSGEGIPAATMRMLKLNIAWDEDRMLFGDSDEAAQHARYERLKSYGLIGAQSRTQRQAEVDRFMDGRAKYCLFTASSGGTGLSLEHADSSTGPRNLYAPPIYSGMTFVQLMGRPHRRNSISNTKMFICLMAGTVEQNHVAPNLSTKLQALGAGSSVKDDLSDALLDLAPEEFTTRDESDTTPFDKPLSANVEEIDGDFDINEEDEE